MSTIDQILTAVIRREGTRYVHARHDRGGPTHYGITRPTLERWRGQPVSDDDLRTLTETEARAIYRARYVEAPGFLTATEDSALLGALVDYAVHSGPKAAVLALQRVVGVPPDGILGPETVRATRLLAPEDVLWGVLLLRVEMLSRLVARQPTQRVWYRGWVLRVLEQVPAVGDGPHAPVA